jgi:HAD superfamily hydrolase (TIGR01509 family)
LECNVTYLPQNSQTKINTNIKNFIFDLGAVIIDLDYSDTAKAFADLSGKTEQEIEGIYQSTDAFLKYEKGMIGDDEFRMMLRSFLGEQLTDESLDTAWNAMLGDLPVQRLELLNNLRKKHKVYVLSNTNAIHIKAFNKILNQASGKTDLFDFADGVFYSHILQLRKPDVEIYEAVIRLTGINPAESLFMDDKKENLLGAESVGIQTKHITTPNQILELEKYVG